MANRVLPQPAPPQTRVGRPWGNPPPVISSSPVIPVGHLDRTSRIGFAFLLGLAIYSSLDFKKTCAGEILHLQFNLMHVQFVEYPPDFIGRQGFQVFRRQDRFFPGLVFGLSTRHQSSGALAKGGACFGGGTGPVLLVFHCGSHLFKSGLPKGEDFCKFAERTLFVFKNS
jgi:hypothetical protein